MKLRKTLSVLCAIAMLASALPAASAAEAEPLSEYAGQTITVQAIEQTENGPVSRLVEVAIPDGATEAEKDALVYSTAFGQDTATTRSVPSGILYQLSNYTDLEITQTVQKVGGGPRPDGVKYFNKAYIVTQVKSAGSTNVGLVFQVKDADTPDAAPPAVTVPIQPTAMEIVINCGGLPLTAKGINVFCKTDRAWNVNLSFCTVYGVVG